MAMATRAFSITLLCSQKKPSPPTIQSHSNRDQKHSTIKHEASTHQEKAQMVDTNTNPRMVPSSASIPTGEYLQAILVKDEKQQSSGSGDRGRSIGWGCAVNWLRRYCGKGRRGLGCEGYDVLEGVVAKKK